MDQMYALIKEVQESFLVPSANGKAPSINLILGFPASRVVSNTFLLFVSCESLFIIATRIN